MPQIQTAGGSSVSKSSALTTQTLFSSQNLTDGTEQTSSAIDCAALYHKTVGIQTTHTGTISDYFVRVKFQSSNTSTATDFRTIAEYEIRDDITINLTVDDTRRYFRITLTSEGTATVANYVTVDATLDALGE